MPASQVDLSAAGPGSDDESGYDVGHEEQVQQSGEQEHIDTKLAESTWQAMQIGAASSDNPVSDALRLLMKHGKLILLSVTVVVLVLSIIASVFKPSSGALQRGRPLPRDLPAVITLATHASAAAGLLKPIATSCRRVHDGGIDFIVSTVSAARQAEKAAKSNLTPGASDGGAAPAAAAAAARDPFARESRDARMVVAPRVPPEHVLVLNKFPTLAGHALLVTDAFREQATPLTAGDFAAWYAVVAAADAVGFFNSAAEAGASQRHKHMQLVPLASFAPCTQSRGLPIDAAILTATARASAAAATNDSEAAMFRLPNFKFKHGLTLLPPQRTLQHDGGDGGGAGAPLLAIYSALLRQTGLLDCAAAPGDCASAGGDGDSGNSAGAGTMAPAAALAPHNVLLTTRWMLVVPRARAGCAGVNVNGLGFMGSLLVHADGDGSGDGGAGGAPDVRPMSVLSCVTVPDAP